MTNTVGRREFLVRSARWTATATLAGWSGNRSAFAAERPNLPVAGITTVYRRNSHADVILGKILEGYNQQGGPGPDLKLASMYVEQTPKGDLSRQLAKKYNVPIFDSIEKAITLGGDRVAVAGVLSIGEHGNYPYTEDTHQHKYPRRRFFEEITATLAKFGKNVPVFNDKHLSWNWKDAQHMYETARQMKFPFMAGSSIPVAWRQPGLELPMNCEIKQAVGIGFGGLESYGFHALEGLQCMVERRQGGETGVVSVQAVQGDGIWKAEQQGRWSRPLVEAALAAQPGFKRDGWEQRLNKSAALYLIEYQDGLRATLVMANGVVGNFGFAAKLKGESQPAACMIALQEGQPYGHFSFLLRGIEHMIHSGKSAYPVERTLLTTGILDRAMHSLAEGQKKYTTPELAAIRYNASDWPFAKTPVGVPPKTPAGV